MRSVAPRPASGPPSKPADGRTDRPEASKLWPVPDEPPIHRWRTLGFRAAWAFGSLSALGQGLQGAGPAFAITYGGLAGTLYGAVMGAWLARRNRHAWRWLGGVLDPIPAGGLRSALRAARTGPVPDDPALRRAALTVCACHLIGLADRRSVQLTWLFGCILTVCAAS
jgi:hypothetical protein